MAIAFAARKQQGGRIFSLAFLLLCAFLGALHGKNYLILSGNHISFIQPSRGPISISGIIESDPVQGGSRISFILKAKEAITGNQFYRIRGKAQVNVFAKKEFSYGDEVTLEGVLCRPFSYGKKTNFSYRDYLKNQGIYSIFSVKKENRIVVLSIGRGNYLKSLVLGMKRWAKGTFERYLWPVNSAVLSGIMLGERQNIPDDIRQSFIRTGTGHIIAISGFNVGIVVFLALILLKVLGIKRRLRYLLTIPLLIIHMLAVGAASSVVRATIMAISVLIGCLLERDTDIINSLSLSALIILWFNPMQLFDAGFQLSYICVLGIVLLSPRIINLFKKALVSTKTGNPLNSAGIIKLIELKLIHFIKVILNGLAVSFSAWLVTLGFVAYYFRIISPVTLLANLIVVPLTSLIITLGSSLAISAMVCPSLSCQIAAATNLTMAFLFNITSGLSRLPFAYFYL